VIIPDVNLLIYAHRGEMTQHERASRWLNETLLRPEPVGVSDIVTAGFFRIVTAKGFYPEPTPPALALEECAALRSHQNAHIIHPTNRTWGLFERLCRESGIAGRHVADAYLAALAIENGAELASADTGFARFPGLRWVNPLA
jgi:toxin-antitoxin system PIN domain toxin